MINNFATHTADMLLVDQKMYMEFNTDQRRMRGPGMPDVQPLKDPSNPCARMPNMTCKKVGVEQVNGRTCDHWQITDKSGKTTNSSDRPAAAFPRQDGQRLGYVADDEHPRRRTGSQPLPGSGGLPEDGHGKHDAGHASAATVREKTFIKYCFERGRLQATRKVQQMNSALDAAENAAAGKIRKHPISCRRLKPTHSRKSKLDASLKAGSTLK